MPIFSSRPSLVLCLAVVCLGTACGDDPSPAAAAASGSDAAVPATPAGNDAGDATTAPRADAAAATKAEVGLDLLDAAGVLAPDAGPGLADALTTPVDSGNGTGKADAGTLDSAVATSDARVADAAATNQDASVADPPDAGPPLCIERGASCDTGSCCEDSLCVLDDSGGGAHCVTPCEFPDRCNGCGDYCGAEPGASSLHCFEPILLAKDGSYLGRAASATFAPEGVCNPNSLYGNDFGTYSIHNKNGMYGNSFSLQSPYAPNNFDGPAIACPDEQVRIAYVNKAGSGFDDVDPDELCDWLSQRGY